MLFGSLSPSEDVKMGAGQPHEVLAAICKQSAANLPGQGLVPPAAHCRHRGPGGSHPVACMISHHWQAVIGLPGPGRGPFAGTSLCPAAA